MALIIRKYGGSSIATIKKLNFVAKQIKTLVSKGNKVVCVVSAMGKETNRLLNTAYKVTTEPNKRELDMLLSIGERQSISLMAIALNSLGVSAVSYTGSQVSIITDDNHGDARILEVKADRVKQALKEGKVVVVAGYQGISRFKEITTLGRGGTDTTAVALASVLEADRCELMKDVDGVFQVSPNIVKNSFIHKELSYKHLQKMAENGAEVIAYSATKLAEEKKIVLGIGNTFSNKIGTKVLKLAQSFPKTQVVLADCFFSNTSLQKKTKYTQLFFLREKHFFIDLNPDHPKKNALLLTLLHYPDLFYQKVLFSVQKLAPIFYQITSEQFTLLIPQKEKRRLKEIITEVLNLSPTIS